MFQHTAARRRLGKDATRMADSLLFQHTAARRRLVMDQHQAVADLEFQHTAARRRLERQNREKPHQKRVSTHSRPKAAGTFGQLHI